MTANEVIYRTYFATGLDNIRAQMNPRLYTWDVITHREIFLKR
jgi:hypothetical protein